MQLRAMHQLTLNNPTHRQGSSVPFHVFTNKLRQEKLVSYATQPGHQPIGSHSRSAGSVCCVETGPGEAETPAHQPAHGAQGTSAVTDTKA